MGCSVWAEAGRDDDGDMAVRRQASVTAALALEDARDDGARENWVNGSPRSCRDG